MKKDKPHGQWIVITAIIGLPPFGQTADGVRDATLPRLSRSGVRTRLKELEQMGLVRSWKNKGDKTRRYIATEDAWTIWRAGVNGIMALRIMRNTHAILEGERAVELAPIKAKWDATIRQRMQMVAQSVLTNPTAFE